jgi:rhodanese-related sulfurtransferase
MKGKWTIGFFPVRKLAQLTTAAVLGMSSLSTVVLAQTEPTPSNVYTGTLLDSGQLTPEVSTDELQQMLERGAGVVYDARSPVEYAIGHIPGARTAGPAGEQVQTVQQQVTDKSTPLVLYCNGPFCPASKALGSDLVEAGYTNVRRYQLGAPMWRALIGTTQIELQGIEYVHGRDQTAVFLDTRGADEFAAGTFSGARNLPMGEIDQAKTDGRLPMIDHNTRIIVFGNNADQARAVAEALAASAFYNVSFYAGPVADLVAEHDTRTPAEAMHALELITGAEPRPAPASVDRADAMHHLDLVVGAWPKVTTPLSEQTRDDWRQSLRSTATPR